MFRASCLVSRVHFQQTFSRVNRRWFARVLGGFFFFTERASKAWAFFFFEKKKKRSLARDQDRNLSLYLSLARILLLSHFFHAQREEIILSASIFVLQISFD